MFSFLAELRRRRRRLNPRVEIDDGIRMVVISHTDDESLLRWLKENKRYTLIEFDIEARLGVRLETLRQDVS